MYGYVNTTVPTVLRPFNVLLHLKDTQTMTVYAFKGWGRYSLLKATLMGTCSHFCVADHMNMR